MITAVPLVVLALVLRVWVMRAIPVIETDGVAYVVIARAIRDGGGALDVLFPPLYPLAIAAVQPLVGDWETAGRLVSVAAGTALVIVVYGYVRAFLGEREAIVAGVLTAVHPGLVRSSVAVLSEPMYTLVVLVASLAAWRGLTRGHAIWLGVGGLLFGAAYLVRPEGLLYLAGVVALAVRAAVRAGGDRRLVAGAAAAAGGFVVVAAPYLAFLRGATGGFTLSGKVAHAFDVDYGFVPSPVALARRVVEGAFLTEKYVLPELLPGVLVLFLLPGLLPRATRDWTRCQGLLLLASTPPLVALAFHVETRVFLPALPFLLPLVAAGIVRIADAVAAPARRPLALSALMLVVVLAVAPFTLRPLNRSDRGDRLYREAAAWLAAADTSQAAVMDRKPFVAFYSGRRYVALPALAPERLLERAHQARAGVVVLDNRHDDRVALTPLLFAPPPPGLRILRDFTDGPARLRLLAVEADR